MKAPLVLRMLYQKVILIPKEDTMELQEDAMVSQTAVLEADGGEG